MNNFEYYIPVLKDDIRITYIRILLTRIQKEKEIEAESSLADRIIPFNLETLVLDIKTF